MEILFLSGWFPYPTDNGSKLRIYHLLRGLGERHRIHLLTFCDRAVDKTQLGRLREVCSYVEVVPWKPYQPASPGALLALLNPTPRSIVDTFSTEMDLKISAAIRQQNYDVVVASELRMAPYWHSFAPVPAVFDDLEVGVYESVFARAPSSLHQWRYRMTRLKQRRYLRALLPKFRACTVVSEQERVLVQERVPGYEPIEVIPNCINLADYQNVPEDHQEQSLIFTGSFRYEPNHDAMVWFLDQVLPGIQARIPEVRLTITGDHANLSLPLAQGVTLTGYVADVRPLLGNAAVSVVPLRLGGGTRLKILEAMAMGTPVVSTSKGAEGLEVENGRHLLLADSASEFAEAVVGILQNRELRARLRREGRRRVAERYDWRVVLPRFLDLVEWAGEPGRPEDASRCKP